MKRAALYSAIFHLIIFLLLMTSFHSFFHRAPLNQPPLMIEVANVSDMSTAPKLAPEPKKKEKAEKPLEEKKQAPPQKQPEQVKPKEPEPQKPEPKPEKKEPPEKKKEAEPIPDAKKPPKKPEPPKEKAQEPKQKPKAEINLTKKKKSGTEKKASDKAFDDLIEEESEGAEDTDGLPASKVGDTISTSELDLLRRHLRKCWIVQAGAQNAKDLVVDVDVEIAPDGTVTKAKISDAKRAETDGFYRAAAESARRAVLDPKCNPLPLPKDKYDQWKETTLSFNPKDMF